MFKKIYFQLSIAVKDTANPLSHHTLASSNFFNWMQALAPVKAQNSDVSYKTFFMRTDKEKKYWFVFFYFKVVRISIGD